MVVLKLFELHSWGDILSMPISPAFIPKLWKAAKQSNLLVIHYPFPLADIGVTLARPATLPPIIVYWHSEIVSQKLSRALVKPFTLCMLRRCRRIVVSSPKLIEHSKILSQFRSKCVVIPFGYEPKDLDKQGKDGGYFLFVGRHVPYKGIDILLKAVEKSGVSVIMVGDGPLLNANIELANSLGIEERVTFKTGISDTELEMLMKNCKALVLPSVLPSEAFALVQIEAMCFGKPVINTDLASGVPWVARNELEGITVRPNDSDDLAKALDRLDCNKELLEQLGNGAKKRWRDCFSLNKFTHSTQTLYSEIMESRDA